MNKSAEQKTFFPREMNEQVKKSLLKKFNKYRIVFWYDPDKELRADFEAMQLDDVEKVEINNNEFGLKYRLLREEPETKFLLYKEGPQPEDMQNWLLDVQLAHGEFRTDQAALWAAELELGYEFTPVITAHRLFFNSNERRADLKQKLDRHDSEAQVRLKMLGVCCGCDARVDSVLEALLAEHAQESDEEKPGEKLLERSNLQAFLWERVQRTYGYSSKSPSIHDFVIELFKSCYAMEVGGTTLLEPEAIVFLKHWKDSQSQGAVFETHSAQCAENLAIANDLPRHDYRDLIDCDFFELIDQKILSDLTAEVLDNTISEGECAKIVRQRRTSRWYDKYQHIYKTLQNGAQLLTQLGQLKLEFDSPQQALLAYTGSLFRIDQLYRMFLYHARMANSWTLLDLLADEVRSRYTNQFLRPLGDQWQRHVDALAGWDIPQAHAQQQFFDRSVKKFRDKQRKIVVVISDALRYEVGEELVSRIRQENRFDAEIEHAISSLPSYTQLGMASLLPHESLEIHDETAQVLVDGQNSAGTANREKILNAGDQGEAKALKAETILEMRSDECKALIRDHELIYIYHNRIDKVGDQRDSERRVFEATEDALDDLVQVVKKLTSGNASNILITADHGFLYQDEEVAEADYSIAEPEGELLITNRRFVLGRNLQEVDGVRKFTAEQLRLAGDLELLLPKSINRFRKKGAGTRFLHGGCTLQEVVIPVISVNKSRTSDLAVVDVDLLPSSSQSITTGQLAIVLFQRDAVTDKLRPRTLRIGIYGPGDELLSDRQEIDFDATSENARERETKIQLVLSHEAENFNNKEVALRLEERVGATTHYQQYKSVNYTIRRSFTSDFD